jgi:predicted nucleic acid-binding protein
LVPTLVIAEVAHLVDRDLGPSSESAFLADIVEGTLEPIPLEPGDWRRIFDLVWTYRDLPLGAVDASIVAQAERLRIRQIATLDRRDFSVVRPTHLEAFELLP